MSDIDRRIVDEHEQNQGPKKQLESAMRLLVGRATMYAATDDHGKRLANQAFTNGIDFTEDDQAWSNWPKYMKRRDPTPSGVRARAKL